MIFKLQIDKNCEESVTALVHERTALIDEIESLVMQENILDQIPGYIEDEIIMLDIKQVECFFVEAGKTFAKLRGWKKLSGKKRLYELEAILPVNFEKINKSSLANWKKISKFKVQLSGAVDAEFVSGYTEYISRRCFSDLRKRYTMEAQDDVIRSVRKTGKKEDAKQLALEVFNECVAYLGMEHKETETVGMMLFGLLGEEQGELDDGEDSV